LTESEFFFDTPIYTPLKLEKDVIENIIFSDNEFEGYNPWKKVESTFIVKEVNGESSYFRSYGGYARISVKCKRTDAIFRYYIHWNMKENILIKIGQQPSIADFHISEIKQYKKLLSTEKLKEFTRAIGLAANGVGIGSFVYLRRIFEYLIHEAYNLCKTDGLILITEEDYKKARMDQKIAMLSAHLPDFLVEHKTMYSILSKGIHELDEETCLLHFDTLRVGIEIILDEKLDELRKREKIEAAKKKLLKVKV